MTTSLPEPSRRYVTNARHYLANALQFLGQGETGKATEMLWGSMAAAIKAVAATRRKSLPSHRDVRNYARDVARQLGDEPLFVAFRDAEALHSNFYETRLEIRDVALVLPGIRQGIARLLALVPPAQAEEQHLV